MQSGQGSRAAGERMLDDVTAILEMASRNCSLAEILTATCQAAEAQLPGALCSVLLLSDDGTRLRLGAAPSLPDAYNEAISGEAIGPDRGSCGTAAYTKQTVVVEDIASDPLWVDYRGLALEYGLRACWSTPMLDNAGDVLGTFAIYYREPKLPERRSREVIDRLSHIGLLAIQHQRAVDRLRLSERRLSQSLIHANLGSWDWDIANGKVYWSERVPELLLGEGAGSRETSVDAFLESVHRDDWAIVKNAVDRSLRDGGAYRAEYRTVWADGSIHWISSSGDLLRDEGGRPLHLLGVMQDITRQRAMADSLREAEERFRTFSERAMMGVYLIQDSTFRYVNPAFANMLGYSVEEIVDRLGPRDVVAPEDWPRISEEIRKATAGEAAYRRRETGGVCKDGRRIQAVIYSSRITYEGRPALLGNVLDVTEQKQAEEISNRLSTVLDATSDLVSYANAGGRLLYINPAGRRLLGLSGAGLTESEVELEASVRVWQAPHMVRQALPAARASGIWRGESVLAGADGRQVLVSQIIVAHKDRSGRIDFYSTIARDVSQQKRDEEKIEFLATHDALTWLPNRTVFSEALGSAIARAKRDGRHLAVLFVDLDRFKKINDTLGHSLGDRLLQEVSDRLRKSIPEFDILARVGGDEFVVALEGLVDPEEAAIVAQTINRSVAQPVSMTAADLVITASIGIAIYPEDGSDAQTLIQHSDVAMYRAKEEGRNTYRFFSAEMNAHDLEHLLLENRLRQAIDANELRLHYQPQIDLVTGAICGLEALLRWHHADFGEIPPGRFIPLAEESGLILEVGEWVLRAVCSQAKRWMEAGVPALRIAVNLSAKQFRQHDLPKMVAAILEETGLDAEWLELEVTETTLMSKADEAVRQLAALRELGVYSAIDDFGTGYSSLAYLKRFPIDTVKIDQSFVSDIPGDPNDAAIAKAVIDLGHSLGLRVVAEGVETVAQADFMKTHGCDGVQGYFYWPALPVDDVLPLLTRLAEKPGAGERS